MIYLTACILGDTPAAHLTRAHVFALSRLGHPIWAIWKDTTPVQPEILDPNFRPILRLGSTTDGHSPEPCHAIIRMGSAMDLITQRAANRAPYEVAFTEWWSTDLPMRLARRLGEFNEVWLRTQEEADVVQAAFSQAGIDTPVRLIHLATDVLGLSRVRPLEASKERLVVAVGEWGGWDRVGDAFEVFANAEVSARLLLVCPNVPFATREELEAYCTENYLPVPVVSTVRVFPRRWDELCGLLAMGDVFLDTTRYVAGSPLQPILNALGIRCLRAPNRQPLDPPRAPYVLPQGWMVADTEYLPGALCNTLEAAQGIPALSFPLSSEARHAMASWDETLAPEAPPVVAANPNAVLPPTLLVIVPFRDRPTKDLEATLRSIVTQLGPMDEVIVSDQGSSDSTFAQVEELCKKYGASLVSEEVFDGTEWNIARARNVGLRHAVEETEWVMCVDADVVLSPNFVSALKMAIVQDSGQGYAPIIDEVPSVSGGWIPRPANEVLGGRIASGCAALPRALVESVNGWDEEYAGYGSEDIDLFLRLRERMFGVVPWECPAGRPQHQAHQPSAVKQEAGQRNLARVSERLRGSLGWEANETGWGDGGVLCLARGEDVA